MKEYFRLLHIPTTSCLLAFAVLGAILAEVVYWDRFLLMVLMLFLGGSVGANYFDEIKGRPWHTQISETNLWIIGFSGFLGSILVGLYLSLTISPWFLLFVLVWCFLTPAYNLELFHGAFHNPQSLAVGWGLSFLGSYYLQSLTVTIPILIVTLFVGACCFRGIIFYEVAKPFSKDKNPRSNEKNRFAWLILRLQILAINGISIPILLYKLLI